MPISILPHLAAHVHARLVLDPLLTGH
ncbi:hypothetical protein BC938DRAFT_482640 [Jimgerdemannia flammicorona]|uniref:Uncharacterized protein n=1 Tax=Jimgerdemannia flammicorona TaxID=994334 RepID=A0A433QDL7_9FUNG|nr:hypothetical protein BC938DRAFT_482640 [Jimgerdemannia flammicorona]